jgi:mRNA interferase RelE/StbE
VRYTVVWLPEATAAFRRLRAANPDGAKQVAQAVAALAEDPQPAGSAELGRSGYRRLRFDNYRVLYQVVTHRDAVDVVNVGAIRITRA